MKNGSRNFDAKSELPISLVLCHGDSCCYDSVPASRMLPPGNETVLQCPTHSSGVDRGNRSLTMRSYREPALTDSFLSRHALDFQ